METAVFIEKVNTGQKVLHLGQPDMLTLAVQIELGVQINILQTGNNKIDLSELDYYFNENDKNQLIKSAIQVYTEEYLKNIANIETLVINLDQELSLSYGAKLTHLINRLQNNNTKSDPLRIIIVARRYLSPKILEAILEKLKSVLTLIDFKATKQGLAINYNNLKPQLTNYHQQQEIKYIIALQEEIVRNNRLDAELRKVREQRYEFKVKNQGLQNEVNELTRITNLLMDQVRHKNYDLLDLYSYQVGRIPGLPALKRALKKSLGKFPYSNSLEIEYKLQRTFQKGGIALVEKWIEEANQKKLAPKAELFQTAYDFMKAHNKTKALHYGNEALKINPNNENLKLNMQHLRNIR